MSSPAKIIFDELKSESQLELENNEVFRARVIRNLISFLKNSAGEAEYPWNQFDVPHDLKLCIQYTDERRGNALIKTITDLLIQNLLGEIDIAIIFRDEGNPIFTEQARATHKVFRVFRSAGGSFIALNSDWLSDFDALYKLRELAGENQKLLMANQAAVQIDLQDYHNFLSSEFQSGLISTLGEVIDLALAQEEAGYRDDNESSLPDAYETAGKVGAV